MLSVLRNGSEPDIQSYSSRMAEFVKENGLNPPSDADKDVPETEVSFLSQHIRNSIRAQISPTQIFSSALFTTSKLRSALSLQDIGCAIYFIVIQYRNPHLEHKLLHVFDIDATGKATLKDRKILAKTPAKPEPEVPTFKSLRKGTDEDKRQYADLMSFFIKLYGLIPEQNYITQISGIYVPLKDKEINKLYLWATHYTDFVLLFTSTTSICGNNIFSREKTLHQNLTQPEISEIVYRIIKQEPAKYVFKIYGDKLLLDKDTFVDKALNTERIPFDESTMLA